MIALSHLTHRFQFPDGSLQDALHDISLEIEGSEYIAVIGPNGSGKTTLARCMNGLLTPTSGCVRVDEIDAGSPGAQWELRRRVGMVFQNPDNQIVSVTVEREIAFGLENIGLPSQEIQERVKTALNTFHLEPYRHHQPHRLSGGEKQRLAIAAVMAMRPRYLILDEPTSLLDPGSRRELSSLLHRIHSETGVTVIHITQFPEEALQAGRLIILVDGRVVEEGDPHSVFQMTDKLHEWNLIPPAAFRLNALIRDSGMSLPVNLFTPAADSENGLITGDSPPQEPQNAPPDSDSRLIISGLTHRYDPGLPTETVALSDVSFHVGKGECVGLIGSTGSGKTTLAEHLIGFMKPESGSVHIDGTDIHAKKKGLNEIRRQIGLVFQFPEIQFFEETVGAEIAFGPRQLGLEEAEIAKRMRESLRLVGLEYDRFCDRIPHHLSAGEKRLIAIASILSMKPEILILDEPTAGLDPGGVIRIGSLMDSLRERGMTIVLISHHMDLVARIADRIIVLDRGHILLEGPPGFIFGHKTLLNSVGLDIPEVAKIMLGLRKKGWKVRTDIFTPEEAKEEIITRHRFSHT